jgi:hypothetical protein
MRISARSELLGEPQGDRPLEDINQKTESGAVGGSDSKACSRNNIGDRAPILGRDSRGPASADRADI